MMHRDNFIVLFKFNVAYCLVMVFACQSLAAIVGDVNQDGRIDLVEAVYSLQVSSGLYPTIPDSCLLAGEGVWVDGADYNVCDVVSFSGFTYTCIAQHTSKSGTIEPTDVTHWTLLMTGEQGPQGVPGPPGGLASADIDLCPAGISGRWHGAMVVTDLSGSNVYIKSTNYQGKYTTMSTASWTSWNNLGSPDTDHQIEEASVSLAAVETEGRWHGAIIARMSDGNVYIRSVNSQSAYIAISTASWTNWNNLGHP